jgi:MFS-type transporter involved in bile tolerance (Atg22 family)
LNIPGGVVGAVSTILIGYLSDKWNDRSLVMIISILPTIAAFAMMIGLDPGELMRDSLGADDFTPTAVLDD